MSKFTVWAAESLETAVRSSVLAALDQEGESSKEEVGKFTPTFQMLLEPQESCQHCEEPSLLGLTETRRSVG